MMSEAKRVSQDHTGAPRKAIWGGAAFLLMLPAVAMLITDEVDWTVLDFVSAAALLFCSAGLMDLAASRSASFAYRAAAAIATGAGFLVLWINAAVGLVGSEQNDYNFWFLVVICAGIAGSIVARFRARGMSLATTLSGLLQIALAVGAMGSNLGDGVLAALSQFFGFSQAPSSTSQRAWKLKRHTARLRYQA